MSETTKEKNQKRLLDYLAKQKCFDCGIKDIRCLTFDHRNRKTKTATVSSLVHKGFTWDRIMKEIGKTDVVCESCHKIRECVRDNSARQRYWEQQQNG